MKFSSLLGCALTWAGAAMPMGALAQKVDSAIVIGQSATIWSEALQEERRVFVYLPPHYRESTLSYPVLYLLDGERFFHHGTGIVQFLAENEQIPEMIVVGIPNTYRTRDLTPSTGQANVFLRFLRDEVRPWVAGRFRVQPFSILGGHSYGGLFALHVLVNDPEAFQGYIAMSPSLWWNDQALLKQAKTAFPTVRSPHFLYLTYADDEAIISKPSAQLAEWFGRHPVRNLTIDARHYPGEDHRTVPHRALYDGLAGMFQGWRMRSYIDEAEQQFDLAAVLAHHEALSRKYGFPVTPSPRAIDHVGHLLLGKAQPAAALEIFEGNARSYPYLAFVHASRGEALAALGRRDDALLAYRRALEIGLSEDISYEHPLDAYRRRVEKN